MSKDIAVSGVNKKEVIEQLMNKNSPSATKQALDNKDKLDASIEKDKLKKADVKVAAKKQELKNKAKDLKETNKTSDQKNKDAQKKLAKGDIAGSLMDSAKAAGKAGDEAANKKKPKTVKEAKETNKTSDQKNKDAQKKLAKGDIAGSLMDSAKAVGKAGNETAGVQSWFYSSYSKIYFFAM